MPKIERGDALERPVLERLSKEVGAALRRRPAQEERLAGVLRVLAETSASLRTLLSDAARTLARRKAFDRPLFVAAIRALAEGADGRASAVFPLAFSAEDAGGLPSLSAAGFARDAGLAPGLARLAGSRHAHLAFAAEVARVARGESQGSSLAALAPKLKESHRIALCIEVFLPLRRGPALSPGVAPALAVLRDSERHLGRWLVLGEVAARAGDRAPLEEAPERAAKGPESARAAWALVAWALRAGASAPAARPTLDLITRLSDRPSAARDMTFLFRLADARASQTRSLLEGFLRNAPADDIGLRAAFYLARDHARGDLREALREASRSRKDAPRGIAAAALFDLGERDAALASAAGSVGSTSLVTMAWSVLVRAAAEGKIAGPLLTETSFRRLSFGWLE